MTSDSAKCRDRCSVRQGDLLVHSEGTVTVRTTHVCEGNHSLQPTLHSLHIPTLPLATLVSPWPCWGQARARLSPANVWYHLPLSPCPPTAEKKRPMEPEEGLYCGRGGWLGCRDIGAVGCRGLGGTQGCACGESKEWGMSQVPAEAASLPCPLLNNTLWGDLAHPHPTELNTDSSEIPSTLPPLWQVWGAGCGVQSVGCREGTWDQDAMCRT